MSSCSICADEVTPKNPLYVCVGCKVVVHKFCYGAEASTEGWKCSASHHICKINFVKCQSCLKKGGAMKQTTSRNWVHVLCALFTNGVKFADEATMEPVDISKATSGQIWICSFCYSAQGHCSKCSQKKCKNGIHITCAQAQKSLKEVVDPENDSIQFHAFCRGHKPSDSSRRLSAVSVKTVVDKKRLMNLQKQGGIDSG